MIFETAEALRGERMASRIYSPFAYPLPRRTPVVPIAAAEAERFAASFPVVWQRGEDGPRLCVLRSLLDDGTGFPPGTERSLALLPLLFQAYPFVFPAGPLKAAGNTRLIDVAGADLPTDAGAPITTADGRLSHGAELRLRALDLFERDHERTLAIGRALGELGLLEPWPLRFDLGFGRSCDVGGLAVVPAGAFDTPRLAPVVARFGIAAARLLGHHRLSLFRAAALLSAARAAVTAGARP
ncbi:SapC family protein [Aureimonas sp. AU12]|uniref:SapC family protein n=1 Tax=Aureimonas sp. AU12 TaxID=1638161 RepID=UPI000783D421|nr:SapC family protein [Aureimonas sp. AU12]